MFLGSWVSSKDNGTQREMDVVLHYEDEYLLDWVYGKVSPGASCRRYLPRRARRLPAVAAPPYSRPGAFRSYWR